MYSLPSLSNETSSHSNTDSDDTDGISVGGAC
jgi:hypothetical protein